MSNNQEGSHGWTKNVVVVLIFSIVVAFLFCLIIIVTVVFKGSLSKSEEGGANPREYQYYQVDPATNESSYGFVTIFEDLGVDEFLSCHNDEGSHVLVSNFGSVERYCSGTCTCEEGRRATGAILTRSIIYLVAATSSFIAYDKARDHFTEECKKEMSSTCSSPSQIKSVVDYCENVPKAELIKDEYTEDGELIEKSKKDSFWCEGTCLPDVFEDEQEQYFADNFNCWQFDTESDVYINHLDQVGEEGGLEMAKEIFINQHLFSFCEEIGQGRFFPDNMEEQWLQFCVSSVDMLNPSVKCRPNLEIFTE